MNDLFLCGRKPVSLISLGLKIPGQVKHAEKALADLGAMKVNLQLLATNEATAAFYNSIGYSVEPRLSMGKVL